ncbi:MAG: hypothetical protein J5I50_05820 [Chitinophagaceae bacterium]|nr:hypothetical protein [Chitinophagaceae bacterium]
MKQIFLSLITFLLCIASKAQVQVNRYSESEISSKGISGKTNIVKEVFIKGVETDEVLKKWEKEKIQKFAAPILVDISPFEQGLWENSDGYLVNRIKITAQEAHSIVVYFDKLNLSKKAELFIYNPEGTILTGPITEKENISVNKLWASNVFQGSSVILEFKVPETERNLNSVHIQKILYGINPKVIRLPTDSLMGPGFGLSSSCNVCLRMGIRKESYCTSYR